MKINPEISIITVNYNGLQETCEMIDSLQEQVHLCTYELIVVDNGSRSDEASLIQKKYPSVKAIRSEQNLGFAGGNNLGMKEAKGKYLFLLNNDTILKDDSLHYLCEQLDSHPQIGAVSPKICFAYSPRQIQYAGFTSMSKYTLRNNAIGFKEIDRGQYNNPCPTSFLHGAALMFRREILDRVGKMPEIYFLYYEEMDWCSQILRAGYQLWYEPRCVIYHKESCSTGQDSPLKTYYIHRNRLLYAWRNCQYINRWITIFYLLSIANPKNIMIHLLKGKTQQIKAIFKGSIDFILLKNKSMS